MDSHFQGALVWDPKNPGWMSGSDPITNMSFFFAKTRDQEETIVILKDTSGAQCLFQEIMSLISRSFA